MAIKRRLHKWERFCPVRFERAVPKIYPKQSHKPLRTSPDIDARGFAPDSNGLVGPVMSMMCLPPPGWNPINKVKLVREDIDQSSSLEAKSTNDAVASVNKPVGKFQGAKEQEIEIRPNSPGDAKIQILYDGNPKFVISELTVRVVNIAGGGNFSIRPYMVTIADAAGNNPIGPAARNYNKLINEVNDIWRPHGIQFNLWASHQKSLNLGISGRLRAAANYKDFDDAIKANDTGGNPPDPNAINVLFVNSIEGAWGITVPVDMGHAPRRPNDVYGVAMGAPDSRHPWSDAITFAHELGHYLHLEHTDEKYSVKGKWRDMWVTRSLLMAGDPVTPPSWHNEVGYGAGQYGALITIRDLNKWDEDGQQDIARSIANDPRSVY